MKEKSWVPGDTFAHTVGQAPTIKLHAQADLWARKGSSLTAMEKIEDAHIRMEFAKVQNILRGIAFFRTALGDEKLNCKLANTLPGPTDAFGGKARA
eukprot:2348157-Prorocentrum_lima.AAC.1